MKRFIRHATFQIISRSALQCVLFENTSFWHISTHFACRDDDDDGTAWGEVGPANALGV